MRDILALLQPIQDSVSKPTLRQLSRIIVAMTAMTGRVTMLGLSRWAEKGGSYRSVQRFFYTVIPWAQVFWVFFRTYLLNSQDTYLLAGDECAVTKAGKQTHGLDHFFTNLQKREVPGLSFFTLSLVSTQQRRSYPIQVGQRIRTASERAESKAKKQAKPSGEKKKPGRPKGSRNKHKAEVVLNPELLFVQKMVRSLLEIVQGMLHLTYLVLDGHFGNCPAFQMARQCRLHLISKLRHDAALHFAYTGPKPKSGPIPRLGEPVDVRKIPDEYLKETKVEDDFETRTYQLQLLHSDFPDP